MKNPFNFSFLKKNTTVAGKTYTEAEVNDFIVKIEALEKENADQKAQLTTAETMINQLNEALKNAESKPTVTSEGVQLAKVEHKGETYQIMYPQVSIPTEEGLKTVTAEELAKSPELIDQLIELESGAIKKI